MSTLARLVSQVRDEVTGQLWQALCELVTPAQRANLETLLVVGEGKRSSLLLPDMPGGRRQLRDPDQPLEGEEES